MAKHKTTLYTLSRYLKWGSVQTSSGEELPTEWLTLIPNRLGYKTLEGMKTKAGSPMQQARLDGLFKGYFNHSVFTEPITIALQNDLQIKMPNPFLLNPGFVVNHRVGSIYLSSENGLVKLSLKHVDIYIEGALRPATFSVQAICDWLANEDPLQNPLPVDAICDWLEVNGQSKSLMDHEDFSAELHWGMQRCTEDSLHLNLVPELSEMAETYIEDEESYFEISRFFP